MLRRKNVDMLSGPIFKGLLALSIPIMIMNVMQTMFNLVDMMILGNYANDTAVGAVGTCSVLITLCTGLFIGVSTGANVVVAKSIGSGDNERTQRAIGTGIMFAALGGVILLVMGVSLAEVFLKLINCPDALLSDATLYFRLYFLGAPMSLLYNFCASILRAGGDTKRPLYFLIIGGIVKVALNYFCIAVLKMTVAGVGIATIVSNTLISGLAFYALLKNEHKTKFYWNRFRFYVSELKSMLFIGIPTGLQMAAYSLANAVIVAAVNSFGEDATTGVSIANQFDGLLYQISVATALAAMPYIAQNLGAKNFARAKKAIWNAVLITTIFGAGFGALSAIFSSQLSSLMSTTPAVIAYSCQKMIIISSTYFICGINEIMGATLKAMGKPIVPTLSTLIYLCLMRFPWVYVIFPLCPTLTFLYLIWPLGWILASATQFIYYLITMPKLERSQAPVEA